MLLEAGKKVSSEKKNENSNRSHLNANGVHLDIMYLILIYKNTDYFSDHRKKCYT